MKPLHIVLPATMISLLAASLCAADAPRPESLIRWRQSAFQVLGWNTGRIKAQLEGNYNKDEVVRAANTIVALANSGFGTTLFAPNSQSGKGWHETAVKPEFFSDTAKANELAANFAREATTLAQLAPQADAATLKPQFLKLTASCKACHDSFKRSD